MLWVLIVISKTEIAIAVTFISIAVFAGIWTNVYGEEHSLNISWKQQQLQEKFDNINPDDYVTYEEQWEKVQQTIEYLKAWGWRGYR